MIYLFSVVLTLFVVLLLYVVKEHKKINKQQSNTNKFFNESLAEIEKYAYTDIRELNDYLTKVKAKVKEWGVIDE